MQNNSSVADPRLRVNRTATLALSTSWQSVILNGSSTYNVNTFGFAANGERVVTYDQTNNLFKFNTEFDKNFTLQLSFRTSTNLITTKSTLQYRLEIPNGGGGGVPVYFPFPDVAGAEYVDVADVTLLANGLNSDVIPLSIYVNSMVRANGFRIQVRLSNALITLGVCNLTNMNALIT